MDAGQIDPGAWADRYRNKLALMEELTDELVRPADEDMARIIKHFHVVDENDEGDEEAYVG